MPCELKNGAFALEEWDDTGENNHKMADADDLTHFATRLRNSLFDLSRRLQCIPDAETLDSIIFRLQQISRHLVRMGSRFSEISRTIAAVTSILETVYVERTRVIVDTVEGGSGSNGLVGRRKFHIPREQLQYMVDYDISVPDIAFALGVSKSTIKRRMREYGISVRAQQTALTDAALDNLVRDIQTQFPNAGYRRVYSQLKSRSINVTLSRVRESLHRTDPDGVAMRWLSVTPRTVYSVRGPLSLWHIDGNHKLIR